MHGSAVSFLAPALGFASNLSHTIIREQREDDEHSLRSDTSSTTDISISDEELDEDFDECSNEYMDEQMDEQLDEHMDEVADRPLLAHDAASVASANDEPEFHKFDGPLGRNPDDEPEMGEREFWAFIREEMGDFAEQEWIDMCEFAVIHSYVFHTLTLS